MNALLSTNAEQAEQVLAYGTGVRRHARALVIAFGVLSIVLGSTGILVNLLMGYCGWEDYQLVMASRKPRYVPPRLTRPPVNQTLGPDALAAAAVAMPPAERDALIESMTKRKPLSASRRRQLDALLAVQGTKLGAEKIVYRATRPHPDAGEPEGDYFKTARGEVAVYDDQAIFNPPAMGGSVRVFAPDDPSVASASGTPSTRPAPGKYSTAIGGLSREEIDAVVREIDSLAQASNTRRFGLAPKQVAALEAELSAPGEVWVVPGNSGNAIESCYHDGSRVTIQFANSAVLVMDAKGKVLSQGLPAPPIPPFTISPRGIVAHIATSVLSAGLAVVLLVAGILTLRRSPASRWLHLLYAWLKFPVAAAGALCFAYVMSRMSNDLAAGAGLAFDIRYRIGISWTEALTTAGRLAALGCIYPLVLLAVLNTRAAKTYFRSLSGGKVS